jgi:uncharacterized Fe-S cluster protein YjdI
MMKKYTNGELTVLWNPEKCIHARECVKGLPQVFSHESTPWVNMKGASSEEIMSVVDKCPSGALTYEKAGSAEEAEKPCAEIKIVKNGPLLVGGVCVLIDPEGEVAAARGPYALCRCGGSKKKPLCDGTHIKIGFDDTK